jgi:hypothetical protein
MDLFQIQKCREKISGHTGGASALTNEYVDKEFKE